MTEEATPLQLPSEGDGPITRQSRTKARQQNERIKLASSVCNSIALAIFALVALRLLLDPTAQPPGRYVIVMAVGIVVALEAVAFYILGLLKAES